jgi:hypothetical protein
VQGIEKFIIPFLQHKKAQKCQTQNHIPYTIMKILPVKLWA